jgi:hypothetical protein
MLVVGSCKNEGNFSLHYTADDKTTNLSTSPKKEHLILPYFQQSQKKY